MKNRFNGTKADWAELKEHIRLAEMHECAAPEEDVEGCYCNRCIKARELSAAN